MKIDGDVTFAFNQIPEGRHIEFTLDFVIDTVTPPTVTLDPRVINAPTLPTLTNGLRVVLNFIGVVDDVDTRFTYIGGTISTGGAGITFPITPPVDARGNVSTTQDINLAATTAHVTTMTLTGDIAITLSNIPPNLTQIEWEIEIKQDGTGGHDVTSWPTGTTPIPVLDQTAGNTTIVVLRVNDGGTIIRTLLGGGGAGDASQWANFAAVTDINYATFDGINIDRLLFDQAAGSSLAGTSTGTTSDANSNLNSNVPALKQHSFFANAVEMMRIVESTAGVYRLDMLDHSIVNAQDVRLDDTSGAVVFAGTDPAIGYDSVASRFILNMPTGATLFVTNNLVIGSLQIDNNNLTVDNINVQDVLQFGVDVTVPTVNGEFRMDGTDVFVFSGGAVRNLSNTGAGSPLTTKGDVFGFSTVNARIPIGTNDQVLTADSAEALGVKWADAASAGANTTLSNLTSPTSVNRDLIPDQATGGNLGSGVATENWFNIFLGRVQFSAKMSEVTSQGSIQLVDNAGNDDMIFNVPSATLDRFVWDMNGVAQMILNATDLILDGVNLDMDGNLIKDSGDITFLIDNTDIGDSTIPAGQVFLREIQFPDLVSSLTAANREIISQSLGGANAIVMNLPTNEDFIITENAAAVNFLLKIDTSANVLSIGIGGSILAMNLNDKSISFGTGVAMDFASGNGFAFLNSDTSFDDQDITDVNNLFITTAAGVAVASIRGIDATPDLLEIRLGGAVDFIITDNGTVRAEFDNTLLTWKFGGSSLLQLPQETQISDRASAPSTPPSGFMSLYVINVAGVQTFKVKFDNGTEKTIATDV